VLQGATTLPEFFEKAKEYEQIAGIGESSNFAMAAEESPNSDSEKMIEEAYKMVAGLQNTDEIRNSQNKADNVNSKTISLGDRTVQIWDLKRKIDALQEMVEKFRDQRDQENSQVNRTTQRSTNYKRQRNQVRNSNDNYNQQIINQRYVNQQPYITDNNHNNHVYDKVNDREHSIDCNQQNGQDHRQEIWSGDQQQPGFTGVIENNRGTRPVNLANETEHRRQHEQGTHRLPSRTQLSPNNREFMPAHWHNTPMVPYPGPNRTASGPNRIPQASNRAFSNIATTHINGNGTSTQDQILNFDSRNCSSRHQGINPASNRAPHTTINRGEPKSKWENMEWRERHETQKWIIDHAKPGSKLLIGDSIVEYLFREKG
jgi:hypothetical protein